MDGGMKKQKFRIREWNKRQKNNQKIQKKEREKKKHGSERNF